MILPWLAAAALAPAPADESPRAFVERLYAGYRDPDYSPLERPERVFAPPVVAAIREDQRLSRDEVGYMDADPLCQCQDPAGLSPLIAEVRRPGARTASARILLRFGVDGDGDREVSLQLVRTPSGWRIADVATPDSPSMLRELRRFNARRRRP
jgi:hypothetical protein